MPLNQMPEPNSELKTRAVDHVTSTIKGVVGAVPIVGPFLTEVVGTLVPNQRVDRIADFAQKLHDRIEAVEEADLKSRLANENFTDLLEESLQQAARSTSNERREYIASLVATGINSDDVTYIEQKHLLRIMGELNDIEIIWLIYYSQERYMGQTTEFQIKHDEILAPISVDMGSTQRERDQEALQDSYKLHLERLGLLQINDRGLHDIAPLGRLLVRHIGMENVA